MKRALLIFLSLILALVGWSTLGAGDDFYVIPTIKGNYAPVPKTGQTTPSAAGDDGTWQKGVASPTPRFTDNNNGTVTDKLTGLIWLQDAGVLGAKNWADALTAANTLASGSGGLTDGSRAGDWRLPNIRELQSLVDYGRVFPALPADHLFINVGSAAYWSSTSNANPTFARNMNLSDGFESYQDKTGGTAFVLCVRGGR